MRKIIVLALALFTLGTVNAQNYRLLKDPRHGNNMYVGFISDSLLKTDTSCKWFSDAQRVYKPKDKVMTAFKQNKDSVNFLVFMGTWCEDSHFVVPRFFKILDTLGYNKNRVTVLATDRDKKDLTNLTTTLGVTNVPTIIVYKNGKELGRVVEYGYSGRYDEELAAIVQGKTPAK